MNCVPAQGQFSVLLLDTSTEHTASIIDALHVSGISATAFQSKQKLLEFAKRQRVNLAVLSLHSSAWWQDELRLFCNSIRHLQKNPEPEILCILNWPPTNAEEEAMNRISGDALRVDVRHDW